jgi:predicted dehydrogenase
MISGQSVMVNMAYAETPLEKECFPETLVFIEGERGSIETTPGCWVHVTTAEGTHRSRVLPQRSVWVDPEYAVAQASMVPCIRNLLAALRHEGEAETHGKDNLKTMQAVFAAYDSAASGQPIRMVT